MTTTERRTFGGPEDHMHHALNGAGECVSSRQGYWASLDFAGRPAVVFGGGGSAVRHVVSLMQSGANVTVVSSEVDATIEDLAGRGLLDWRQRDFDDNDLEDVWLAVAASEQADLDGRISRACDDRRLWCILEPRDVRRASGDGRVTLVGGGPGDPGLLTVAGLEALRAADVVVTDRLAPVSVLAGLGPAVKVIDVGKIPFGKATPQERINEILIDHARAGCAVVRLKGGDSFLFGRGGEELIACREASIPVSVIPGVTSAFAVPAAAGIPVTHRGVTQGVIVVSGHVPPDDQASTVDYAALARSGTTLVFLMAVATLSAITEALLRHGMPPDTPAITIADGTLAHQRTVRGTLTNIGKIVVTEGIKPPAITVIGSVADFGDMAASSDSDGYASQSPTRPAMKPLPVS